jgi:quercetin dioxygenase-like cupin family protein
MSLNRPKAIATLQVENDRVIVTQWDFPIGAETGWHKHVHDYIVVPCGQGRLHLETNDDSKVAQLEAGQSYYRTSGVEHNVVNANDYEFSFVEIELK